MKHSGWLEGAQRTITLFVDGEIAAVNVEFLLLSTCRDPITLALIFDLLLLSILWIVSRGWHVEF